MCVFTGLTPWLYRLRPRCWCGRYVVWFTVWYCTHTDTHKFSVTHTDTCTLSLNNMAVVLETLTKVSVEASKQRNDRAEKNQSTRQLTPVQNTGTHSANQFSALPGLWVECVGWYVLRLEWWGDDVRQFFLCPTDPAAGIKRFLLRGFLFQRPILMATNYNFEPQLLAENGNFVIFKLEKKI